MFTHFNIIWFPKRLKPLLEIVLNKISTHITQLLAKIYLVVFVHAGLMLMNPVNLMINLNYKWLTPGVLQLVDGNFNLGFRWGVWAGFSQAADLQLD